MTALRIAGRILLLQAAVIVAFFVVSVWQSWNAHSVATEIFAEIRKGMPEIAVKDMAESGTDQFIVLKSGGGLLCRIVVTTKDGVVVDSVQPVCF